MMAQLTDIATELDGALERGEFRLQYQPIINVETSQVCCCEALLRWQHPQRGPIPPDQFIPLAEATGSIVPVGAWVLREACMEAASWPSHVRVAVNVSAVQLQKPGLAEAVLTALGQSGLPPNRLEIEITESVLLDDIPAVLDTLRGLRAIGVRFSLDDFGTGYCSLAYLRSLTFNKIKIDRSFTNDMPKDPYARAVMRAIVRLGNSLGLTTTAEGVETADQMTLIRAEGCAEAQGYLFSRPKAANEIRNFLYAAEANAPASKQGSWSQAEPLLPQAADAEDRRLQALYEYDILDTPAEESFDRITRLAKNALQAPMAMVSLVDRDRQWFKSRQGCETQETARNISFCTYTVRDNVPLIVSDALNDARFQNSPLVTGAPHVRAYVVGVPLRTPDGHNIGALCVNDVKPREITQDQINTLQDSARLVVDELELRKLATKDALTGAMSRRAFLAEGNKDIERARRSVQELGCVVFDIDHFKAVNDFYGHGAGDVLLREVIAACRAELRSTDSLGSSRRRRIRRAVARHVTGSGRGDRREAAREDRPTHRQVCTARTARDR